MSSRAFFFRLALFLVALSALSTARAACVWKVTGPDGGVLYLGGSIHGLESTDYPLPAAYSRAFDASSALVIEVDPDVSRRTAEKFYKSGFYSSGDSLKNHVDPRTYEYVRRVLATHGVPESQVAKCKPWMLTTMLWGQGTNGLGIEAFLLKRARANRKPVLGLESFREHNEVFSGLPDKQAELVLVATFIPLGKGSDLRQQMLSAWRRGDADEIARLGRQSEKDLPSFSERLITERNRNWIPRIEGYLHDRRTYFVVGGAAHMGGPNGVIALLRARRCRVEQL